MRAEVLSLLAIGLLAGCDRNPSASTPGPKSPGRYAGIGMFDAGRLWAQMARGPTSNDAAAARIDDDEHIIVVIDSHTGEVRQCGDHSGVCVAMNPWSTTAAVASLPVKLTKHATDLARDDKTEAEQPPPEKTAAPQ